MAKTFFESIVLKGYIDFEQNEARNMRAHTLAAAPGSPVEAQWWYDSVNHVLYYWNGTSWFAGTTYTDEQARDVIGAALVAGNNIDITVNDAGDTITIDVEALTSADLTDFAEAVSDQVGTMVTGNTETGIAVTYQDADNTIDFVVDFSGAVMDGDAAGGVLSGTYPNPGFAADMATQAELNAVDSALDGRLDAVEANNWVTTVRIADAQVTAAKLSFDPATQAELDAHVNDTVDAHDASAISFAPAAGIAATDVQAAIVEDAGDLAAHLADTVDAHDATAISFAPSGDISATDVQSAVLEALADAKAYSDALASGLKLHTSVKAIATTALDLTGAETVDGYATATNDRILVIAQADADENGIWLANNAGAWTRPTDFDGAGEVAEGAFTFVEEGSAYEGTGWTLAEVAGTFGSLTEQTWTQFSGAGEIIAGAALTKTGNTLDVAVGAGIEISGDAVRIAAAAAGAGLTGGAGSALDVAVGFGIEISGDTVRIAAAAAGAGLTGGAGAALDVVAGTGLEISADTVRIAAAAAGNGLTGGAGSALAVGAGTGISVAADAVAVDTAVVVRKYAVGITGGATSEVVTHNLNTRDVTLALVNNSTPWDAVEVEWEATSVNTVTLRSPVNLPAGYRCVVHG